MLPFILLLGVLARASRQEERADPQEEKNGVNRLHAQRPGPTPPTSKNPPGSA